jgi:hypothetical protein
MLLLNDFGSHYDPNISVTPGSGYVELVKTRSFDLFWPVLYPITHWFLVPLCFKMFRELRGPVTCNSSKSQFLPIVAIFVWYYSLIFGPAVTRMFVEPRGPVTGNSSKLAFLVYSSQFCMLLLTDFGLRCNPNIS